MGLVAAKCTQCGADIEVDASKEAGICRYCGTAFITEKAINNYNAYVTNHNNFAGANITIQGGSELEELIERAKAFVKLDDFAQARYAYGKVTALYPMDYRGWLGLVTCETKNDSIIGISEYAHDNILKYFENALKVAGPEVQKDILEQREEYELLYKNEKVRRETGENIAYICNQHSQVHVEKALGCDCGDADTFDRFDYVLGHDVEYLVLINGHHSDRKTTCEKAVNMSNIEELLSAYKKKKEGCYIATCVYGSYDCPQVWTLRRFRDQTLGGTWYGRFFVKCYYAVSPVLVKRFGGREWFRWFWKYGLDKMVSALNDRGVDDSPYSDR